MLVQSVSKGLCGRLAVGRFDQGRDFCGRWREEWELKTALDQSTESLIPNLSLEPLSGCVEGHQL